MSRLVFSRKPARFAMARLAGAIMPGAGASVGIGVPGSDSPARVKACMLSAFCG